MPLASVERHRDVRRDVRRVARLGRARGARRRSRARRLRDDQTHGAPIPLFRVLAVDNRGVGRSSKPHDPYSIDQMAADLTALLERFGLARAHLLGISMGGRIALSLALSRPDLVDRLVLVSTGPRPGGRLVRLAVTTTNLPVLRGHYPQPRYAMKAQFGAMTMYDCADRLGEVSCPTLVAHGRSDRTAPVSMASQMAGRIPPAGSLFDGGHLLAFGRQRERMLAEVEMFLGASTAGPADSPTPGSTRPS